MAPMEWQYSGLISRIPAENTGITFKKGLPERSATGIPQPNHSITEYVDIIGLERSNMQWPAIMLKVSHDLYMTSEIAGLEDEGEDISSIETSSDYWEFWFVKEGEDTYYLLMLSAKEFSQEEAEKIARTVIIK